MADKHKTGRIVGTAAVLAMIYMATRARAPSHGDNNLHLLPPPAAQVPDK